MLPRMLKWTSSTQPDFNSLRKYVFDPEDGGYVIVKKLTTTSAEMQKHYRAYAFRSKSEVVAHNVNDDNIPNVEESNEDVQDTIA
ncbi:hypothetical protein TIFTF001_029402 [Ficus carica]|uniref:Uncharacterized protein n=1 Tax=Ficus carica TaxID=3494 RepID=A0AA88J2D7_FICCA|nr:hypothetical protein TIFTF001_029402 [Ficus carica]